MFLLTCEQASFYKRKREEGPPDRRWKMEKGQTPRLNGLVDLCPTNGSKRWQISFPINTNELYSKIKTEGKSFLPPLFVCRIANFQKCNGESSFCFLYFLSREVKLLTWNTFDNNISFMQQFHGFPRLQASVYFLL